MADLTPNNREEYWLKGMVDGQTTLEPNKRREYWYKEIVDAIGSGGGGGTGGNVAVFHLTDAPYLAQAFQTALSDAITKGLTSHANQPFHYKAELFSNDIAAEMEAIITFLTNNNGSMIYLEASGVMIPAAYRSDTGYLSFKIKQKNRGVFTADFDVEIVEIPNSSVVVGAQITFYGWVSNIFESNISEGE